MSLRNRARALQRKTGLTYQQALQRVRALGERPATLSRQSGWTLEVCDRFLIDGHAPIAVVEAGPGDAPVEAGDAPVAARDAPVAAAAARASREAIERVCESLRGNAAARAVRVIDLHGRVIAHAGGERDPASDDGLSSVEAPVKTRSKTRYARIAATRATLTVAFHRDETSLGLVRLRMAKAVDELEQLLAADETPMMPPAGGGGGASGAPSELRVAAAPAEKRPKKKPTPIGRKRKRDR